jgi:hypothetical protein
VYADYGFLDANDPDADGGYDVGPVQDGVGVGADAYADQGRAGSGEADGGEDPPVPYAAATAGGDESWSVARRLPVMQASLYNSEAVTLVFKDGRAQEKIHNYALTRTTLYVTDGRRREIPVASLDLAATEEANRADGIRFQLPGTP